MHRFISCGERVAALAALIVLMPVLIFTAILIYCLSGRTPLVAHRRVGRFGKPFWVLKFRTMWNRERGGAAHIIERVPEQEKVPEIKAGVDPRVTSRFAAFCRRHSIDELPQLWHVACGEMSLVGPRPVTIAEWQTHYGDRATEVLRLKPGLTGLWQTRGRNRLSYRQRRRLDVFLTRHYCLLLYLRILGHTIPRVIAGRDAW